MQENWQTIRRLLGYYPRVLRLVWAASPRYAFGATFFAIVSALAAPAKLWLMKGIIDGILVVVQERASAPNATVHWQTVLLPVSVLLVTLVVGEVAQRLNESMQQILRFQVEHYARYLMLAKATQLDLAFYEAATFYDELERAHQDSWRMLNLARLTTESIGPLLALGVTLAMVAQLHPLAVGLLLLVALPRMVIDVRHAKDAFNLYVLQTRARRMVDYLATLLVTRDAVKEIRIFGLQAPFLARVQHYWQQFFSDLTSMTFTQDRQHLLWIIVSAVGTGVVWIFAILQALIGRITIGELTLLLQAIDRVRLDLREIFHRSGIFYEHALFISHFFSFLDRQPDAGAGALRPNDPTKPLLPFPTPLQQGIEFCNVSFGYPGTERLTLQNLSFSIRPGATVALVGANGAGKTTLVKLLARFYDPTAGVILLDGRDLREYDVNDLRQHIGVIFQDFVRYHLTAKENIGLGQFTYCDDLARIRDAAEKAGATPVIDRLPDKYETFLGKTFEEGVDLSGGEWQKLALGRAFMRDAPILILDEPTAALDALAEYEVYKRFAELTTGKTTIFISHRFSTVRMAQQILVLENGHLIEEGTHAELMAHNGQYAKMFTAQAERYL